MRSAAARAKASASSNAFVDFARLEWIVDARSEKNLRSGGPAKYSTTNTKSRKFIAKNEKPSQEKPCPSASSAAIAPAGKSAARETKAIAIHLFIVVNRGFRRR